MNAKRQNYVGWARRSPFIDGRRVHLAPIRPANHHRHTTRPLAVGGSAANGRDRLNNETGRRATDPGSGGDIRRGGFQWPILSFTALKRRRAWRICLDLRSTRVDSAAELMVEERENTREAGWGAHPGHRARRSRDSGFFGPLPYAELLHAGHSHGRRSAMMHLVGMLFPATANAWTKGYSI